MKEKEFIRYPEKTLLVQSPIHLRISNLITLIKGVKEGTADSEDIDDLYEESIELAYHLKLQFSPKGIDDLIEELEDEARENPELIRN